MIQMIMAGFIAYNPQILTNSATGNIFYWAIAIVAVAFGCSLYYLIKVRSQQPV